MTGKPEVISSPVLSLAKTLGVLSFTPLTMLQACAQAVDFKVGHHFGEGQHQLRACGEEFEVAATSPPAMAMLGC
jgi:hypothetical protein